METETPGSSRKWIGFLVGAVISVGAIALIFSKVDFGEFTGHFRRANPTFLLLLLLAYPATALIRCLRFSYILQEPVTYWRLFHIININYILNATLPFRTGEVARVVLIAREPNQNTGAGLSALVLERLLDVACALLAVGCGLILLPDSNALDSDTRSRLGILIVLALIGMVGVLLLQFIHPLLLRTMTFLTKPLPEQVAKSLVTFTADTLAGFRSLATPGRLLRSLTGSIVLWISYAAFYQIGLLAFMESRPPIGVGLLTLGFVALGAAVPSLPGAVGVFQAAAVLALTTAGYDAALAASIAWGVWVPQITMILVMGIISLWVLGLSFAQVAREARSEIPQNP